MARQAITVLVIDDDPDILVAARVVLRQEFETVITEPNPEKFKAILRSTPVDVVILDMNYRAGRSSGNEGLFYLREILTLKPDCNVIMITAYGEINLAVEAMKLGAVDFVVKPWDNEKLISTIKSISGKKRNTFDVLPLVGNSTPMQHLRNKIEKVGPTDASILIQGENGTGKELVARSIHATSLRKNAPFVKVDVGALSATLFESEMFGVAKGAFTDAKSDRPGRFEMADGGTLFLDEIANISYESQGKLLSVLQERKVSRVGSNDPIDINIRLICATNVNLSLAVDSGNFRKDLFFRINTIEVSVPSLKQRAADIPELAEFFIRRFSEKYNKEIRSLTSQQITNLQRRSWPGNVRELENIMERAVILSENSELTFDNMPQKISEQLHDEHEVVNLDEIERRAIITAIQRHGGNMSKVAKDLGLGRTTLYRKMIKYGINNS